LDFLVEFSEPTFDNFLGLDHYLQNLLRRQIDLITTAGLSPYLKPHVEKEVRWHEVK